MLSTIFLILSLFSMFLGVIIDIKEKKFPNYIVIILLFLGMFYYCQTNSIKELIVPLCMFVLFNFIGIYLHKIKLVAPGDMKFFSLFPFFIDWSTKTSIVFIFILAFVSMIYVSIRIFRKEKSLKSIFTNFENQIFELKVFLLSKIRISADYTQISKDEGIAFTVPLFISFLIILSCQQFGYI